MMGTLSIVVSIIAILIVVALGYAIWTCIQECKELDETSTKLHNGPED
jgi:hypothetical protein